MARKNYRVGVPEEVNIPEEEIIPPAENVSVETQTKVIEVEAGKVPYSPVEDLVLYQVRVTHPSLRRRSEPSTSSEVMGLITDMGIYDIYSEELGWGQLQDKSWIMLSFCKKIKKDK